MTKSKLHLRNIILIILWRRICRIEEKKKQQPESCLFIYWDTVIEHLHVGVHLKENRLLRVWVISIAGRKSLDDELWRLNLNSDEDEKEWKFWNLFRQKHWKYLMNSVKIESLSPDLLNQINSIVRDKSMSGHERDDELSCELTMLEESVKKKLWVWTIKNCR